jgi:hypothetical protein
MEFWPRRALPFGRDPFVKRDDAEGHPLCGDGLETCRKDFGADPFVARKLADRSAQIIVGTLVACRPAGERTTPRLVLISLERLFRISLAIIKDSKVLSKTFCFKRDLSLRVPIIDCFFSSVSDILRDFLMEIGATKLITFHDK